MHDYTEKMEFQSMDSDENIEGCLTGRVWLEDNYGIKSAPAGFGLVVRTSWPGLLFRDPVRLLRLK